MRSPVILVCVLLSCCLRWPGKAEAATSTNGVVFESGHCTGIRHAVVRFLPPRESGKSVVVTITDGEGSFSASLPGDGDYYVTVSDGNTQVFGHALSVQSTHILFIPLLPVSGQSLPPGECENRFEKAIANKRTLLRGIRPVGLAFLPSGLLILDASTNRLLQVQPTGVRIWIDLHNVTSIDVATLQLGAERGKVFVLTTAGNVGSLTMYSEVGALERVWRSPQPASRVFTGLATDPSTQSVYLAAPAPTLSLSQIFRLDLRSLNEHAQMKNLGQTPGSSNQPVTIGPLAADSQNSRLLAVDDWGTLYAFNLQRTGSQAIHSEALHLPHPLDYPRALALDSSSTLLYVIAKKRVWRLQIGTNPIQMQQFAPAHAFHGPASLAISPNGNIWVGDEDDHAVYEFSADGQVLSSLSAIRQ